MLILLFLLTRGEMTNVRITEAEREKYVLMIARFCWVPGPNKPALKLGQYNQRKMVPGEGEKRNNNFTSKCTECMKNDSVPWQWKGSMSPKKSNLHKEVTNHGEEIGIV